MLFPTEKLEQMQAPEQQQTSYAINFCKEHI